MSHGRVEMVCVRRECVRRRECVGGECEWEWEERVCVWELGESVCVGARRECV